MTAAALQATGEQAGVPVGTPGTGFENLLSVDGLRYGLSTFEDRDLVVLIFTSNRCPTAKAYAERMNELQREYGPRGVQLVAINANDPGLYPDESYPRMTERAVEDGLTFPYLVDEGQRLARAYAATCTFHVFVLDRERRLRYRGRFDDSRIAANVTQHDLINAINDLLAGREVGLAETRPFGCSLDLV